ncbi:MAG: hypothetical protein CMO80_13200 [Verrucomicrobiales bacterium]|nr:hypothetical protein [Verrucomicrobiales bacterium]
MIEDHSAALELQRFGLRQVQDAAAQPPTPRQNCGLIDSPPGEGSCAVAIHETRFMNEWFAMFSLSQRESAG